MTNNGKMIRFPNLSVLLSASPLPKRDFRPLQFGENIIWKDPLADHFCKQTNLIIFFFVELQPTEALGFNTLSMYSVLQYDLPPLRPHYGEAPAPGPIFEPGTGDPEAGTLTTRPPHLFNTKKLRIAFLEKLSILLKKFKKNYPLLSF